MITGAPAGFPFGGYMSKFFRNKTDINIENDIIDAGTLWKLDSEEKYLILVNDDEHVHIDYKNNKDIFLQVES